MKNHTKYLFLAGGILLGGTALFLLAKVTKKHFDLSLFDSPDQPGSGKKMDKGFLARLKKAEKIAGLNFSFTSAFRSHDYNHKVGGVHNSAHTTGNAVDISANSIEERDRIVWAATKAGFRRIGIGERFVHVDDDATKSQDVAWGYPLGSPPPYNPFG